MKINDVFQGAHRTYGIFSPKVNICEITEIGPQDIPELYKRLHFLPWRSVFSIAGIRYEFGTSRDAEMLREGIHLTMKIHGVLLG